MPFLVIKGTFHVEGYEPDGDSMRFEADDPGMWLELDRMSANLEGHRVNLNARGHAQLRFEGIDALETHYQSDHQPLLYAEGARDKLFKLMGIKNVQFAPSGVVSSADDGTRGYILSRASDKYNRPIAFAFAGNPAEDDGEPVTLLADRLQESANHQLVAAGLAYPTFYEGLFSDLRIELTRVAKRAKSRKRNLWKLDKTTSGAEIHGLPSITDEHVIMPKLFRRLRDFLDGGGTLAGFKAFLKIKRERVLITSQCHFTHFDDIVEVQGDTVRLRVPPEDLVFSD